MNARSNGQLVVSFLAGLLVVVLVQNRLDDWWLNDGSGVAVMTAAAFVLSALMAVVWPKWVQLPLPIERLRDVNFFSAAVSKMSPRWRSIAEDSSERQERSDSRLSP